MSKSLRKSDIHISDWEFEFQQRGEQTILLSDWYIKGVAKHFAEAFQLEVPAYDYIFTASSKGYVNKAKKADLLDKQRQKLKDPKYIGYVLTQSIAVPKAFAILAERINKSVSDPTVPNRKLAALWEEMSEEFEALMPWFWIPYYLSSENMITDLVRDGLKKHRRDVETITDLNDALLTLVFPIKEASFQREQKDLFELAVTAQENTDFIHDQAFNALAETYLKKYDWVTTFLIMPLEPLTKDGLIERLQTALKENLIDNFRSQQETKKLNVEKAEKLLELLKDDEVLLRHIADARELGYALTASIEIALSASARCLPLVRLAAERLHIPYRAMRLFLSDEIVSALREEIELTPEMIQKREEGYVMMFKDNEQYVTFGRDGLELSHWVDEKVNKVTDKIIELRGQVACKGSARGWVQIAFEPAQSRTLEEGEILVCPMTNPDYVPAMKRSAAIITDEGGLLSHAAIMSREFGIPCIIGTKFATQVLHDGDLVEVDAEQGIVRIIERSAAV